MRWPCFVMCICFICAREEQCLEASRRDVSLSSERLRTSSCKLDTYLNFFLSASSIKKWIFTDRREVSCFLIMYNIYNIHDNRRRGPLAQLVRARVLWARGRGIEAPMVQSRFYWCKPVRSCWMVKICFVNRGDSNDVMCIECTIAQNKVTRDQPPIPWSTAAFWTGDVHILPGFSVTEGCASFREWSVRSLRGHEPCCLQF
jgi:hypothetical protein